MTGDEEGEGEEGNQVIGKCVRISIKEQLKSFRRIDSSNKGSTSSSSSIKPQQKVQHVRPSSTDQPRFKEDSEGEPAESSPIVFETGDFQNVEEPNIDNVESQSLFADAGEESVTNEKRKENIIRPIDRGVVHQICSGQVIVTLSTAVKELVENSLDAGATKVDIRLQEYGSKLIEVSDNGSGINEGNFEGLALKHHTSKISEFEDLTGLSTFGFRGEALSSLCALSKLTVTTREGSSDQRTGFKIEFDNYGRLISKTRCAREGGTTVILKDLFHTLPVRHREFIKNLKKEFHRMVNILYGYCLVVNGARISCTNQVGNGGPTKVIGVPSYNSMKERIVALFGSKQFSSLLEIKQCDTVPEEILSEFGLNEQSYTKSYQVEGYISAPNQGRSSNDRQFFFINSRPCDPVKISRVINEVYHSFSRSQNPFVCLHITTNRNGVDVNVTPDKRTLYIQNEKILLATLKASLLPLLTGAASSYDSMSSQISTQLLLNFGSQSNSQVEEKDSMNISPSSTFRFKMERNPTENSSQNYSDDVFDKQYSSSSSIGTVRTSSAVSRTESFLKSLKKSSSDSPNLYKRLREYESQSSTYKQDRAKFPKLTNFLSKYEAPEKKSIHSRNEKQTNPEEDTDLEEMKVDERNTNSSQETSIPVELPESEDDIQVLYDDEDAENERDDEAQASQTVSNKTTRISVNWQEISAKLTSIKLKNDTNSTDISYARRFRAKISPEDNNTAEEELKQQITQDMFCKMEIIGQFNLGFIIVKSGPDLFIVDQHASDEKYNFEDLEKSMTLQGQVLISEPKALSSWDIAINPIDLELPAISENIIMDNIEVFQKNGFDFIISSEAEPTKRVKLSKIPYSKNTEFGKADVEELVFMMEDSSDKSFYRPTKVRQMLASRACRKSVMIGTALSEKDMRDILDHMGEMAQPWNCPHGRPTIRHLINLNLLPDMDHTRFTH